jgi:hypothetical protein
MRSSIEAAPRVNILGFLRPGWMAEQHLRRAEQELHTALKLYAESYLPNEGNVVLAETPYIVQCPVILKAHQTGEGVSSFHLSMMDEHDVSRPTRQRGVREILYRCCQKAEITVNVKKDNHIAGVLLGYGQWKAEGDSRKEIEKNMVEIYKKFPEMTPIERITDQADVLGLFIQGVKIPNSHFEEKYVYLNMFYSPMTRKLFLKVRKFELQRLKRELT